MSFHCRGKKRIVTESIKDLGIVPVQIEKLLYHPFVITGRRSFVFNYRTVSIVGQLPEQITISLNGAEPRAVLGFRPSERLSAGESFIYIKLFPGLENEPIRSGIGMVFAVRAAPNSRRGDHFSNGISGALRVAAMLTDHTAVFVRHRGAALDAEGIAFDY